VVPMPHPGHQICGMRSLRRNCSTGLTASLLECLASHCRSSAGLHDYFENVLRVVNAAAGVRHGECLSLTRGSAFYFSHHLAKIEFGDDKCFHTGCEFAILFSGKGHAVIRRNLPTHSPRSRAASMARCATREVIP